MPNIANKRKFATDALAREGIADNQLIDMKKVMGAKNDPKELKKVFDGIERKSRKGISHDFRFGEEAKSRGNALAKLTAENVKASKKKAARIAALKGVGRVAAKAIPGIGLIASIGDIESLGPRADATNPLDSAGYKIEQGRYDLLTSEERTALEVSGGHDFSSEIPNEEGKMKPNKFRALRELIGR